ncbi:MAG: menaquinone biosynthesis protein [Terrimicrobiaceae bacterium]|nr:menaquinone biosynthesis protein [Terrimicrobiaceae bacterium]
MSELPNGCRVGSVPYLNARPLIYGLEGRVTLDVPSQLAARFAAGGLDAALLPVYEAVARERALIADDIAIASDGAVFSVFLAHRQPLAELEAIALDPSSRTSSHLLRCLLAEFHGLDPRYDPAPRDAAQGRLLIGDPAIAFRRAHDADGWQFLDLGAEWRRCTDLPFVFACWVFREDLREPGALADALRTVKRRGLAARAEIAAECADAEFARRYLTEFIQFDLGENEKRAVALFAALLRKHGLVTGTADAEIRYV